MAIETNRKGVALVTGAGKRVGKVIALRLAEEGYALALHCNRSRREAELVMAEIIGRGGRAAVVQAELSDAGQVAELVHAASATLGPLSLLVNNASVFEDDRLQTFEVETLQTHMAVNLVAPLILSRDFAAQVQEGEEGAIVNIVDQRVLRPNPLFFSYYLSKSALLTATRTMAQALAPRIRVNAVGPGPTLANTHEGEAKFAVEARETLLAHASAPDDIAQAVSYLASARSVTGQMIAVDAGQHLVWKTVDIVSE